jgi:hypothetical protein
MKLMRFSLLIAIVVVLAANAGAEPERASRMFERGRALAADGNYEEACKLFDRSFELEPALGTLLNRADCREHLGDLAGAWRLFTIALQQATRDADSLRQTFARGRIESLEGRLVTAVVTIDSIDPRMGVSINGRSIAPATTITERVNPGEVVVEITAPNASTYVQRQQAQAGATITFAVPPDAFASIATTLPSNNPDVSADARNRNVWLGLAIGGVGIGLAGAGVFFAGKARIDDAQRDLCRGGGYLSSSTPSTIDGIDCRAVGFPQLTNSEFEALNERGFEGSKMTRVGFVIGVFGAGLAAASSYMYFTRKPTRHTRDMGFVPSVAPGFAGATLHARW